jgi:hypothetical protein
MIDENENERLMFSLANKELMFSLGEVSARLMLAGMMLESLQAHAKRTEQPKVIDACRTIYEAYNAAIYQTKILPNWELFAPRK